MWYKGFEKFYFYIEFMFTFEIQMLSVQVLVEGDIIIGKKLIYLIFFAVGEFIIF